MHAGKCPKFASSCAIYRQYPVFSLVLGGGGRVNRLSRVEKKDPAMMAFAAKCPGHPVSVRKVPVALLDGKR
ncbi:MAG: hypothetical protein K9L83_08365, partial [Deltaproteobacteria bacterium]|nr:hypothetical protein [Deltaproteobacteria bacterium]